MRVRFRGVPLYVEPVDIVLGDFYLLSSPVCWTVNCFKLYLGQQGIHPDCVFFPLPDLSIVLRLQLLITTRRNAGGSGGKGEMVDVQKSELISLLVNLRSKSLFFF